MGCTDLLKDVSFPVYLLIILFAWAAWIDINGLFVEVPLLVNELPEGWNLPSYMALIIQFANIGPIVYTIATKAAPNKVKEWPVVYIIIGIGATSCMLLAFLWDRTTTIGGTTHSTAFLTLTACLALVDCTSSVVFLPYMAQFRTQYMTAYYIGEGLSGLIPGLVGLIQGVGSDPVCVNTTTVVINETTGINTTEYELVAEYEDPLFGVGAFFIFLFCMLIISGLSFSILHFLPYCKQERTLPSHTYNIKDVGVFNINVEDEDREKAKKDPEVSDHEFTPRDGIGLKAEEASGFPASGNTSSEADLTKTSSDISLDSNEAGQKRLPRSQVVFLLIVVAWVNAILNGVLPSTQSFTCLPYGNLAYTLAVRLATVANPLMCFVALFVPKRSLVVVSVLTVVATALTGYQLYLAAMSPDPPLEHETSGVALVILSSIIIAGCLAYIKVTIAIMLRDHGGKKSLLWCGGMTQVGSCIGAIVIFLVINVGKVFQSEDVCPVQ